MYGEEANQKIVDAIAAEKAKEDIAIAVKKGNKELLDLINKGLAELKADGSYDKLKAKWNLL